MPSLEPIDHGEPPQILYIDAYDSFSNNIVALVQEAIGANITVVTIDDSRFVTADDSAFFSYIQNFDAVIAGPGPGNPTNLEDVGLMDKLWRLPDHDLLPVLGICLGFQSLCFAFGAVIERLVEPRHGIVTPIIHCNKDLFEDLGMIEATQYHSLHANVGQITQLDDGGVAASVHLWRESTVCPSLEALAWDCSDARNGLVLMGVKHRFKPFFGVQYHPESICTSGDRARIIRNWWTGVERRRKSLFKERRISRAQRAYTLDGNNAFPQETGPKKASLETSDNQHPRLNSSHYHSPELLVESTYDCCHADLFPSRKTLSERVHFEVIHFDKSRFRLQALCDLMTDASGEAIVLESGMQQNGNPVNAGTGRYSILACSVSEAYPRLHYFLDDHRLLKQISTKESEEMTVTHIWSYLQDFMDRHKITNGPSSVPFWGGLIGFASYEAGLDTINVSPPRNELSSKKPNLSFTFIQRSIVVDHIRGEVWVQSIRKHDERWLERAISEIRNCLRSKSGDQNGFQSAKPSDIVDASNLPGPRDAILKAPVGAYLQGAEIGVPLKVPYLTRILACQEAIRAGDSYELCLTDLSVVKIPSTDDSECPSLDLYRHLQTLNASPFSAYVRLEVPGPAGGVIILSSSPERFLRWDRDGRCEFRPIKGTVKKTPGMTLEKARRTLKSSKERAENLMIVDLIRHDLHGVVGAGNVHVTKLMGVEEYQTVYQLVSVIEGQLPRASSQNALANGLTSGVKETAAQEPASGKTPTGMSLLAASLPPGSMTGAPKKRSCEILRNIEGHAKPRGIYSGVLGYLDVGGGGDFSVVIRSAVKWDCDAEEIIDGSGKKRRYDMWTVGAGGAVTAQSTPEGEWEEMCAKRDSTLRMFRADSIPG